MKSFFDSSAVLATLRSESSTRDVKRILEGTTRPFGAQTLSAECTTAVNRWYREGLISETKCDELLANIHVALTGVRIQSIDDDVNQAVADLTRQYPLKAADAIQLASWKVLQTALEEPVAFVCLDRRLREAAIQEGATIEPLLQP